MKVIRCSAFIDIQCRVPVLHRVKTNKMITATVRFIAVMYPILFSGHQLAAKP